jgi:crotonobetaine/carnitine-CoA ligase
MRERFSPTAFWDDVRTHGCTAAGIFGPLLNMLMMQPEKPDDADNPMIGMICAPLPETHDDFTRRFGVKLATGYGMSETGAVFMSRGWDIADWRSCGRVRQGPPGFEVRVVNEHDEPLGPGEVGELIVRADEPWVLNAGYLGLPDKTAEAWRNGWFHTGDGFKYDEDGNFYFVDRMKDAIRRRAENISSMEVEVYVTSHPEVAESAAFGVPSEIGEEEVKVCVVRTEGSELTAEALIDFLEPQMPPFMLPRFVEFVDALPKTEVTMRIRKVELKADPFNDRTWDRQAVKALA